MLSEGQVLLQGAVVAQVIASIAQDLGAGEETCAHARAAAGHVRVIRVVEAHEGRDRDHRPADVAVARGDRRVAAHVRPGHLSFQVDAGVRQHHHARPGVRFREVVREAAAGGGLLLVGLVKGHAAPDVAAPGLEVVVLAAQPPVLGDDLEADRKDERQKLRYEDHVRRLRQRDLDLAVLARDARVLEVPERQQTLAPCLQVECIEAVDLAGVLGGHRPVGIGKAHVRPVELRMGGSREQGEAEEGGEEAFHEHVTSSE
ncbi:hypothetical protein D3C72_1487030 [compost metagenome]